MVIPLGYNLNIIYTDYVAMDAVLALEICQCSNIATLLLNQTS